MGSALSRLNQYDDAITAYKNAVKMEPSSSIYKNNLDMAEKKVNDDRQRANTLKEIGNALLKDSRNQEAIFEYTEAIKIIRDPTFFCNRAAAFCCLRQYNAAIQVGLSSYIYIILLSWFQDCNTAISLDNGYAKAYGRLGFALTCQNRFSEAVDAYKKALKFDPMNDTYKNNLTLAEEKKGKVCLGAYFQSYYCIIFQDFFMSFNGFKDRF